MEAWRGAYRESARMRDARMRECEQESRAKEEMGKGWSLEVSEEGLLLCGVGGVD